jgi:deoxyribodipyrimidine photo-lyase
VTELAWREFYADVVHHNPGSLTSDLNPLGLDYDDPGEGLDAWREGRTGYPIVDAGMRQLLAVGWMHNRVRMITASFLTKDLHAWWPIGARHFLDHLIDGDLASNTHGWQWTAGTGTDAAPYFRVFNPVTQAEKFDPEGDYVRRYVPELRHLPGAAAHRPWEAVDGYAEGYPQRIVDHAAERAEALARYQRARGSQRDQ